LSENKPSVELGPIWISRRSEPFESDDYLFGLKIDGFRSFAYIENGECQLVSRNGKTFRNFKNLAQCIGENLRVENADIDGEIACVDDSGRSTFNDLCGCGIRAHRVRLSYRAIRP
jgi:bifunctional non-homologous end joining protein LigD